MRGGCLQLLDHAGQHDPPMVDDHDVLAHVLDQIQLMTREHHSDARRCGLQKHLAEGGHPEWIQPAERLVEHGELRVVYQRRGQLHPLLVPVGELFQPRTRPVR